MKNRIKALIKKQGTSQGKVAKQLGMDPSYLNKIVNKVVEDPLLSTAFQISNVLGAPLEEVFIFSGKRSRRKKIV